MRQLWVSELFLTWAVASRITSTFMLPSDGVIYLMQTALTLLLDFVLLFLGKFLNVLRESHFVISTDAVFVFTVGSIR